MSRRRSPGPSGRLQLPAYEPPILPLHQAAVRQLMNDIPETYRKPEQATTDALTALTSATDGLQVKDAAQKQLLEKLEEAARGAVDAHARLNGSKNVLREIALAERIRTANAVDPDEDEDQEGNLRNADAAKAVSVEEGVWGRFKDGIEKHGEAWEAMSMVERYADIKEYAEFRRVHWDVLHNDEMPFPAPRYWFDDGDDGDDGGSDDDIEVAREKISFDCPITLKQFQDPVESTVCHHTFERQAIHAMIRQSRGSCKCPTVGCSVKIHLNQLQDNRHIMFKLKRHLEREARERRQQAMEPDNAEDEGEEAEEKTGSR